MKIRRSESELQRFMDWPEDPNTRPMGPLRFVEREVPVEGEIDVVRTVRILQCWCFRQFTDEHTAEFNEQHPRGVQRRGVTGWFDVPLETP